MEHIIKAIKIKDTIINEETLSHISLLPYKHIVPMGTYFVEAEYEKMIIPLVRVI